MCEVLASIRIANGVARDEASHLELGLYGQKRVPHLARLVGVAQRTQAGSEETKIGGELAILFPGYSSPARGLLVVAPDIVGETENGVREEDVRIKRRQP